MIILTASEGSSMLHDMSDIAKEVAEDGGKKRKGSEITLVVQRRMNHLKSNMFNGRPRPRRRWAEDLLVGLLRRLEVEASSC